MLVTLGLLGCSKPSSPPAFRGVQALCFPCGSSGNAAFRSQQELEQLVAAQRATCGEPAIADRWLAQVNDLRIDFESEVLVSVYSVLGTAGTATLDTSGEPGGPLTVDIAWKTSSGPALPVATAACFSILVKRQAYKSIRFFTGPEVPL